MNEVVASQIEFYESQLDALRYDLLICEKAFPNASNEIASIKERFERHEKDFWTAIHAVMEALQ